MENVSKEIHEPLLLKLRNNRFKVDRRQLIRKSQYFTLLLSTNFRDHRANEHAINYKIPPSTFQDFVNWVHDESRYKIDSGQEIKHALQKFTYRGQTIQPLLKLLHLSVLFAANELTDEIIDLIETCWLHPKYLIDIWWVAQDLGIHSLQDITLAMCLDRFGDLPLRDLLSLTSNELAKLIGNINVRSSSLFLRDIRDKWQIYNGNRGVINVIEKKEPNFLHCIIHLEQPENFDSKIYLHYIGENGSLEHFAFGYPKELIREPVLRGMQCGGRRYNLYLCGGEYGDDTGNFNRNIWRYSLLSKKWFIESLMPVPRKNMAVAVVRNMLLFLAGTVEHRPTARLDIYDVFKRSWTKGRNVPEIFNYIPECSALNGKLIIHTLRCTRFFIYYVDLDIWLFFTPVMLSAYLHQCLPLIVYEADTCYLDLRDQHTSGWIVRRIVKNNAICTQTRKCDKYELIGIPFPGQTFTEKSFYVPLPNNQCIFVLSDEIVSPSSIHLHSFYVKDVSNFKSSTLSLPIRLFFRMMNPDYLHNTSNIPI